MAVFNRLWAVAAGILALVIAAFVLLAILNFKQIQSTLLHERLAVLAEVTSGPFEAAARIGLPLAGVRNGAALLERARQSDDAIFGVYVVDQNAQLIRATSGTLVGDFSMRPSPNPELARWSWRKGEHLFTAVRLVGHGGRNVGAVVVEIDTSDSVIRTRAMAAELLTSALMIWGAMTVLSGAALWVWLRPQIEGFRAVETQVERFESDLWGMAVERDQPDAGASLVTALREAYLSFQRGAQERDGRNV